MIRLFNTRKLKNEILEGQISDAQLFFYFWILMTFESIQLGAFIMNPGEVTQHHIVMGWTIIIGNPLGILLCWLANGGRKGEKFLLHVLPIMIVVGIPFSIVLTLLSHIQSYYPDLNTPPYRIGLFYIGNLTMLAVYLYHIRDLAKRRAT